MQIMDFYNTSSHTYHSKLNKSFLNNRLLRGWRMLGRRRERFLIISRIGRCLLRGLPDRGKGRLLRR